MDPLTLRQYEGLSPFEIKDFLAKAADKTATRRAIAYPQRGPRQSQLDRHRAARGVLPARAVRDHREQARAGSAAGSRRNAEGARASPGGSRAGSRTRRRARRRVPAAHGAVGGEEFRFDADAFVHELVDSIIGDNYPVPDRMLVHNEQIVHEYLQWAMCGGRARRDGSSSTRSKAARRRCVTCSSRSRATACSMRATRSRSARRSSRPTSRCRTRGLRPQDRDRQAPQENGFQFTDEELKKLLDPKIKAFFVVNPGNPSRDRAVSRRRSRRSVAILKKRPDLMLLTDDVYGTFVAGLPLAARRVSAATRSACTRSASTSAARAGAWA